MGPDKLLIFLGTNRQVSVSGIKDGKGWEKHGEWKVISNKLVLFLPEDEFPVFIFRTECKTWIFNPSAKALMSQMQRPTRPVPPSANDVRQPRSVLAVNGKISKEQVLNILRTMDDVLANKDASAIVTNFANNAVITATIVEGQRMDTSEKTTQTATASGWRLDLSTLITSNSNAKTFWFRLHPMAGKPRACQPLLKALTIREIQSKIPQGSQPHLRLLTGKSSLPKWIQTEWLNEP